MTDTFNPDLLAGKVAFVAGASSGINLRVAQRYAAAGAKVMVISRSEDKIAAAARTITDAGHDAIGMACDVRDYAKVVEAFAHCRDQFGEIDIVLSGAAGNFLAPAIGMSANAFKTVIDIDLLGTFNVLHASFQHLRKPGASLVSITAGQAVRPMMYQVHACAAKAGVNQITKCLAMEWGPAGIRVNAVSPGPIGDTEGMARLAPNDDYAKASKARIPLRDWGTKDDIGDACLWLASDAARYVSGAIINVDGGSELGDAGGDALTVPER
ncbi:SDR family oxidoreductase [Sphingorhabdus sp.]|jgi:NAD(P)-dependent dehydrogenase (short-subunit alcohol dehydrogenase family)|uniref:SDR family oxidoreductase n=1 Tax=Sphingorhabdus sp. TaxID=1902408 RepID=UPI0035AEE72B|nr:SDR family oxidoreductase [Sphingomonadaceae bacterium]